MAIYHASTKPIARSAGRSAVAAAAYRAGVELVDARTGLSHDYTRKGGIEHTEILTPDGLGAERNALWNAAELAEKRKDARTAREWIVALPAELTADQRTDLARDFGQALVDRYGVAVDFAIHAPDREGDHRNHHAHLRTTTRQVSRGIDGGLILGAKAHIELSDKARRENGLGAAADEVKAVRELWERTANAALERAGVEARIDARSLQAQGIDREASQHLGPVASEMERRGKTSDRGDGNRQVGDNNAERARLSAEIIDLQAERERCERREVARREFGQSHREPAPDHLSVTRAVAALVATQAQRARQATQDHWTERRQRRATRQEMEGRRGRLVALAEALAKDQACRLPLRQAYLDAGCQVQQQGDKWVFVYPPNDLLAERKEVSHARQTWNQRKQGLARDSVTEQESRPGVRHPDKPRWQAERERVLTQAYNADVAEKMGRWYRIERREDALVLTNTQATITDHGDRVTAAAGNDREIEAMIDLARAKGWERVSLTGTAEFQERAAQAFVAAGIALDDPALEQAAQQALRREAIRERALLRHGYRRDAGEVRERWSWRQQQREQRRRAEKELEQHLEREGAGPVPERSSEPASPQKPKPTPRPAPTLQEQVDTFWSAIDREAERIREEAAARIPDVRKRYDALQMAFYATYKWPESPVSRGFLGMRRTDPNWRDPEVERERLQKEIRGLGLSRLEDLARSQHGARNEAMRQAEARDPEGYKQIMGMHDELRRQKAQQTIDRGREIRREKAKPQGKGKETQEVLENQVVAEMRARDVLGQNRKGTDSTPGDDWW